MCKRLRQKDRLCGYMTIEATLILSVVFMVYLFLIRSFLGIYDRCVLEMDMAALALHCANARESMLEQIWQQEVGRLDTQKYLWIDLREPLLQKQGWKLTITGQGEDGQSGKCGVSYEIWKFTPENWLRMNRKIEPEKKKEEGVGSE